MSTDPTIRNALLTGAREFNSGRYFEAHEMLEESLDDLPDAIWDLFVGLIQIAVGYHKITQNLPSGAAGMLQLTEAADNGSRAQIRYKLVQSPSSSAP